MELWAQWVDGIWSAMQILAVRAELGPGLAIIAMTLLFRGLLLPLTWQAAYRGQLRQQTLKRLRPELEALQRRYRDEPRKRAESTLALYERHGMKLVDGPGLLAAFAQLPFVLGVFQALRHGLDQGRFLWVANLGKPDLWLAVLAGVTTALLMAAAPELPQHVRALMVILPAALMLVVALKLASGISLYWATSNLFGMLQTLAVRAAVKRQAVGAAGGAGG